MLLKFFVLKFRLIVSKNVVFVLIKMKTVFCDVENCKESHTKGLDKFEAYKKLPDLATNKKVLSEQIMFHLTSQEISCYKK